MSSTGQGASDDAAALEKARERAQIRAEANEYRQAYRRDKRKSQTVGNMVFALVICLAVVAFLITVTWRPKTEEKPNAVSYTAQLEDARKAAAWVRGPEPMPSGWTATSVEFRTPQQAPITWHLGVVTTEKKYANVMISRRQSLRTLRISEKSSVHTRPACALSGSHRGAVAKAPRSSCFRPITTHSDGKRATSGELV